jgi:CheY-like chemotaxis protein
VRCGTEGHFVAAFSCFIVPARVQLAQLQGAADPNTKEGGPMQSPKGRILYTEDEYDCREMVLFTLRQSGYEVTCVESGSEALALAKSEHFDLLLVDNWLPEMTGPQLTRHIREFNQTTPILFYSGAAFEDDKRAALRAGAQGYLIKPIGIERLTEEVERLITAKLDQPKQ